MGERVKDWVAYSMTDARTPPHSTHHAPPNTHHPPHTTHHAPPTIHSVSRVHRSSGAQSDALLRSSMNVTRSSSEMMLSGDDGLKTLALWPQ